MSTLAIGHLMKWKFYSIVKFLLIDEKLLENLFEQVLKMRQYVENVKVLILIQKLADILNIEFPKISKQLSLLYQFFVGFKKIIHFCHNFTAVNLNSAARPATKDSMLPPKKQNQHE